MTKGKKLKNKVRARMEATGESYMQARLALAKMQLCQHVLVVQGANNEDLCCTKCGYSEPNKSR